MPTIRPPPPRGRRCSAMRRVSPPTFKRPAPSSTILSSDVNTRISADVQQINSIGAAIATLNQQIVTGTAAAGGQPPNELLDQRDQLVSNLSKLVGVTTTTESNGGLNVFIGNGQPLVLQGATTTLTTVANQFNASQLEVSTSTSNGNSISASITLGRSRRPFGGAQPGHQSGAQPTRIDRHRGCAKRQYSAGLGSRFERSIRREFVLRRRSGGHGLVQEHRQHDRERQHRQRRGADREQLSAGVQRRGVYAHRYRHGRECGARGRRHRRESADRRRAIDRAFGNPRGRRSIPGPADCAGGRILERGSDEPIGNCRRRRGAHLGGRHQRRHRDASLPPRSSLPRIRICSTRPPFSS